MASGDSALQVPAQDASRSVLLPEDVATLRDRAVAATGVSFTITDVRADDSPLIWVNPAFTRTTGYEFEDAVGRNCRFLQGPDTDPAAVGELRAAIRAGRSCTTTLYNYRRDGTPFWNELSVAPVRDDDGTLTHFVGVQSDVTRRVEAQLTRDDALAQVARSADRLALLADFTSRLARSQRPEQILDLLAEVLVPRVGTFCVVCTYDESGRLVPPLIRHEHGDRPGVAAQVEALRSTVPEQIQGTSPIWRVLRGDVHEVIVDDYDASPPALTGSAADDRTSLLHQLGLHSMVVVPLLARSGILGALTLVGDAGRQPLDAAGLSLLRDLAARAGLMLENAQLYERERAAAATLQRSMLPRVGALQGLDVATAYVPAADEAAVGGDWYDVFALRPLDAATEGAQDGAATGARGARVGVVVGDVMGHDISSAARMGKLSTIVRSYAWPGSDPNVVLDAADELLDGSGFDYLATCLYAQLLLHDEGATLRYASAGHPPALLRLPDGSTRVLTGGRRRMLGVSRLLAGRGQPILDASVEIPHGGTYICFTDGLVEAAAADPDIDIGLAALIDLSDALPADASPRSIVSGLVGDVRHSDDVAIVAIRVV